MSDAEIAAGLAPTPGYRYAQLVGSQLFVAGQVPLDGAGTPVGVGSVTDQAVRCLDNLRTLVEVHGFTTADVRQLTIYVVGPHDHLLEAWSAVLAWFDGDVPPATLLGVTVLGYREQLVEIDATITR